MSIQGQTVVRVNLLFFAKSRELAGTSSCENFLLSTGSGGTISGLEVLSEICERFRDLAAIRDSVIIAHNEQYCEDLAARLCLRDGDEIAVIPPIAGG
ncbi:molybdopterin synthase sulfur carrier subunit [Topomyia yanbarensis]|uniref:molybdopterin synthase sulfur carrier subunit n=1 Tax=Topomyia yanbarensis TaxID=2498891 RepID=UPI00273B28E6|nr:molybdopterin synthase sulfur carrier subunit [Topomyia yanbarensis]